MKVNKMTNNDLLQLGVRPDRAANFAQPLVAAMAEFDINTTPRQAAFLAQVLHESGMLRYTTEIWGPTPAQARYEGRKDLGNTEPGDGVRFMGRGLLETTGRANYDATGQALGVDLLSDPEQLAQPELAARSAGWFWRVHGLNELADVGDFRRITLRINGGTTGLDERVALYARAQQVLA
jgi:putative chitinase